jgi:hypothetical protein
VGLDQSEDRRVIARASWEQCSATSAHLMTPEPGMFPVRWRVCGFADAAALALMRG